MDRFSWREFERADGSERQKLAAALKETLTLRLKRAPGFHSEILAIIEELRSLGHDLWSFDDSDEREVWCPNYEGGDKPGLILTFAADGVEVEWASTSTPHRI